jgi:hypothetical protein
MTDIELFEIPTGNTSVPQNQIPTQQQKREEYFEEPPKKIEVLKKSSFGKQHPMLLFIASLSFILSIVFAFLPSLNQKLFEEMIDVQMKISPSKEIEQINQEQTLLWSSILIEQSDSEKIWESIYRIEELEKKRLEKLQEVYGKFPYEKFSNTEQLKIKRFHNTMLSFIEGKNTKYIEDLKECFSKSSHNDPDTTSFCISVDSKRLEDLKELSNQISGIFELSKKEEHSLKEKLALPL